MHLFCVFLTIVGKNTLKIAINHHKSIPLRWFKKVFSKNTMRIKLTNFRCYADKEFIFDDRGLVLLKGVTGAGKSTILEGIYFALYGNIKKPYKFGTKTCKVELEIGRLNIVRTCSPNRLVVKYDEETYEDAAAQGIIDQTFMSRDEFIASSYIKQNSNSSILAMTPMEKQNFIRRLALDDEICNNIKTSIKELHRAAQIDLDNARNQLEVSEMSLKELPSEDDFPVKENPIDMAEKDFEAYGKSLLERKAQLKKEKATREQYIASIEKQKAEQQEDLDKLNILNVEIASLKKKIKMISLDSEPKLEQIRTNLKDQETKRENYYLYDKYIEEQQKFEDECEQHFIDLSVEIKDLEIRMLSKSELETKKQEQAAYILYDDKKKQVIRIVKEFNADFPKFKTSSPSTVLEFIEKNLTDVHKCPECNTSVTIKNKVLQKTNRRPREKCYEDWIPILKDAIGKVKVPNQQHILDEQSSIRQTHKELVKQYNSKELSKYLSHRKEYVENMKVDEPSDTLEIMEKRIEHFGNYLARQKLDRARMIELNKELAEKQDEFNLTKRKITVDVKDGKRVEMKLIETNKQLDEIYSKIDEMNEKKLSLVHYNDYLKYQQQIKKWTDKKNIHLKKVKELNDKCTALEKLREKSNQAEIIALETMINSINEEVKDHLEIMFPNELISVRLESFRKVKHDVRYTMNTVIHYKDSDYDNVDQLSGGERQRCELAFELAINSLMGSSILMLDECINNLDVDFNTQIVEILKNYAHSHGKFVIVVSHECVTGLFDCVYEV